MTEPAVLHYAPKRPASTAAIRRSALTLPTGFIPPCLPMTAASPPSGPLWLHEVKHDGYRVIARTDGERVRLYSRPGNDLTERFPLIVEAMTRLPSCTIDGEAVACDDSGIPSFDLLRYRRQDEHVFLYAFDLIEFVGADLRREPLEQRKAEHARSLGLEGIVSKRKDSRYVSGRSPYWLKMKNPTSEAARRERWPLAAQDR